MFYAFCHNWSIVLCETKSKLFPARIPNYQAVFRKVWILYKFGFVEKSKLLDFSTMLVFWSLVSLVRNSVVLAVYFLFSVACFFTVHEHLFTYYHLTWHIHMYLSKSLFQFHLSRNIHFF